MDNIIYFILASIVAVFFIASRISLWKSDKEFKKVKDKLDAERRIELTKLRSFFVKQVLKTTGDKGE